MTEMAQAILPDAPSIDPLKVADRCDECGSQAFVRARFLNGVLDFCGHDFAKSEERITAQALEILDSRHLINEKPSQSSA